MASAEAATSDVMRVTEASTPASRKKTIVIGIGVLAAIAGTAWYISQRGFESTDDAQTDSDVVAVPARVAGTVAHLHFTDNQRVKEGELLVELDDAQAKARLAQSEAMLASAVANSEAADADAELARTNAVGNKSIAEAGLMTASAGAASFTDQIKEGEAEVRSADANYAQSVTNHDRDATLYKSGAIAKAEMDSSDTALTVAQSSLEVAKARLATLKQTANQARSKVAEASARATQTRDVAPLVRQAEAHANAAHASVDTAKAARDLAALDLTYTKIFAPHEGVVSKRTINEGQTVSLGQSVVQLVTPEVWVIANFKETQVGHMHVGQPAHFSIDAFSGKDFQGEIESLSGATGARFSLLPPDNATGNFTKVVQRVPVRIRVHDVPAGVVLRPGMSVDLTVDTRS